MSLAVLESVALRGVMGHAVRVEVHVGPGLPAFNLVGLPDAEVRESRERVRSAILSSGFSFPAGRITANLAPADLPKESGRYDLAIAVGVLAASGQIAAQAEATVQPPELRGYVLAGELSLTGAIVPVDAPLAIALAVASSHPQACLVLPAACAQLAARVPGLRVLAAGSLAQVVAHFRSQQALPQAHDNSPLPTVQAQPCLSEVRGQAGARRALEVAAAGGHGLLMCGPPGAGKSMLAQRLPGLLPRLSREQALEVAALASAAGQAPVWSDAPPWRAPHHSASMAALVGGGLRPRPGEISLAHHGVLFLDELPEFQRRVLESLRQPLETGSITIARAAGAVSYPARFQLVAAMNPCPCGWLGHPRRACRCPAQAVQRYRARLSGPLLDRIDLLYNVPPPRVDWLDEPPGEASASVRQRVQACRAIQQARQGVLNAALDAGGIALHCRLDPDAQQLLRTAMARWEWSARVVHRVLRVARTLADLDGQGTLGAGHLAEAVQYRQQWDAGEAPGQGPAGNGF